MAMTSIIVPVVLFGSCLLAVAAFSSQPSQAFDPDAIDAENVRLTEMAWKYRKFYGDVPDNMALFHPPPQPDTASTSASDDVDTPQHLDDDQFVEKFMKETYGLSKRSDPKVFTKLRAKLPQVRFVADMERAFSYRCDPYLRELLRHIWEQYRHRDEYKSIAKSLWNSYNWQHFVLLFDKLNVLNCVDIHNMFPFKQLREYRMPLVDGLRAWGEGKFLRKQFLMVLADGKFGSKLTSLFAPKKESIESADIIRIALESDAFRENPMHISFELLTCGIRIPLADYLVNFDSEYVRSNEVLPFLPLPIWQRDSHIVWRRTVDVVEEISSHPLIVHYFRHSVHAQFDLAYGHRILKKKVHAASFLSARGDQGYCLLHWLFRQWAHDVLKSVMDEEVFAALKPFADVPAHVLDWCSLVADQTRDYTTNKLTMDDLRAALPRCLFPRSHIGDKFKDVAFASDTQPIDVVRNVLQSVLLAATDPKRVGALPRPQPRRLKPGDRIQSIDAAFCDQIRGIKSYWGKWHLNLNLKYPGTECDQGNLLHCIIRCQREDRSYHLRSHMNLVRELLLEKDHRDFVPFDYADHTLVSRLLLTRVSSFDQHYLQVPSWHQPPDRFSLVRRDVPCLIHTESYIEDAALAAMFQSSPGHFRNILEELGDTSTLLGRLTHPFLYHVDLLPKAGE